MCENSQCFPVGVVRVVGSSVIRCTVYYRHYSRPSSYYASQYDHVRFIVRFE